ncbi:putative pleckstrin homology domain-containing family N member 1 isoform X3 [Cetorhinus maximus]
MGCMIATPRCCRAANEQEHEDLVQIPSARRHSAPPVSGGEVATPQELDKLIGLEEKQFSANNHLLRDRLEELSETELLWGKSRRELEEIIYSEAIIGWEGEDIRSLGEIVWSSSVVLQEQYNAGLLPLSGISVKALMKNTFEITGSMFDSRIITCSDTEEFRIWMAHLPRRVKKASIYRPHKQQKLSVLVPCDEIWKRQELEKYLLQNPIKGWEGTPIQHLGDIIYLSMVKINLVQSQIFEERIMVLFPDDLIILSTDEQKTIVQYEGRLPTQSIRALERSARMGHLEFEITGDMMEPVKVSCAKPGEYKKWFFHLQKPDNSTNTMPSSGQLPPRPPKKRRSCHY